MTAERYELEDTLDVDGGSMDSLLRRILHSSAPARRAGGLSHRLHPGAVLRDGRLRIERRVGDGGMGVVYQAHDAQRDGSVALKTLSHLDPEGVYRLKSEFRALADLLHPNLCRLHELFCDGDDWFFTMELVDGVPFDQFISPNGTFEEARLRTALAQLHDAIMAIHGAGKLHRDLKPSNVLVTRDGRVVVLDFGLVADNAFGGMGQSLGEAHVIGTPAYMAPEQAAGSPAGPASDFYALGVMLFQALTSQLPFEGRVGAMLAAKQRDEAPPVRGLNAAAPEDLAKLCDALLLRAIDDRPDARAIAAALGKSLDGQASLRSYRRHLSGPVLRGSRAVGVGGSQLVGREAELEQLRKAYGESARDQPVVVFVSGESGMGKSALVSAFLDELHWGQRAVVLAGRCHERENVPFKAFDALVDDLSRYLCKQSRELSAAVLPREVFALARLFPVLMRVPVVAEAPERRVEDPQDLRRRAFEAFAELLARIRDRRPLCIHIDDLQWADHDSVLLMRALLVDRDPAPILLVLSHRSEGADSNRGLSAITEVASTNSKLEVRHLRVGPLNAQAAQALALQSLPPGIAGGDTVAPVVAESGGSPFFIGELARHIAREGAISEGLSLPTVLAAQVEALDATSRGLLEMTALIGQPLAAAPLLKASGATRDALDDLRARHLIRRSSAEGHDMLECYHDRIREMVTQQLSAETSTGRYAALAEVLLARDDADPELLSSCLSGAGRPLLAAHYAAVAAARAAQAMAFDRAAELYRRALELGAREDPERHARRVALADSLANAGRGHEAAEAYLAAAEEVEGGENIDLRRRAATELLTSGDLIRGKQLLAAVCEAVGLRLPRSKSAALLSLAMTKTQLRWRKLDVDCSNPARLNAAERLRVEVVQTAAYVLAAHDSLSAAVSADRLLLSALPTRDPRYLAAALQLQAFFLTALSPHEEDRIARLYSLAQRYAREVGDDPVLNGWIELDIGTGYAYARTMSWQQARDHLQKALSLLRGCRGVRYFVDATHIFLLLFPTSELSSEARTAVQVVEEALALGRIWCAGMVASNSTLVRLSTGDAAGVARHMLEVQARWQPQDEMAFVDSSLLRASASIALYHRTPEYALALYEQAWPRYEQSMLGRVAGVRRNMHSERALLSLAVARRKAVGTRRSALRAVAEADRNAVVKYTKDPELPTVLALDAGLALEHGDLDGALAILRRAARKAPTGAAFDDVPRLCARRRLGQLLGGDEGDALVTSAEADMRGMKIVDFEATTEMAFPACWVE